MEQNKTAFYAVAILAIGFIIGAWTVRGVTNDQICGMARGSMHGSMQGMMMGLSGKKGDEFDRAFLSEMIVHHEGAIEMAKSALRDAKRDEIRGMAKMIIDAQADEIETMKIWQRNWFNE